MSSRSVALARLLSAATGVAAMLLGGSLAAAPKPKPLVSRSSTQTSEVTVKAVDVATRHLTIANAKGETQTVKVPAEYKRLDALKPGDKIKATYAVETDIAIAAPGQPLPEDVGGVVGSRTVSGGPPKAGAVSHITVTGAVLAIDMQRHMLKLVSPKGGEVHEIEVTHEDGQKAMSKLKVGDKITVSVTEALLLKVVPS
jgi:hypothetical protein